MKIAIDLPPDGKMEDALRQANAPVGEIRFLASEGSERRADLEWAGDAEVLFCHRPTAEILGLRRLRWVQLNSTGYEQVIGLDFAARGIHVTNCRGCCDIQIAEWNIAMMLNLAHGMGAMWRNQTLARWDQAAAGAGFGEVRDRTVGFWGYGGFARETARQARNLGLNVHVMTRRGVGPRVNTYLVHGTGDPDGLLPHRVFTEGEESAFLNGIDFLIVALPLTRTTEGLIGERELRMLRPAACLLNPARAAIVREEALLRALDEGWIAGAAIDVHYEYPLPEGHPLWRFPQVILTPHVAGGAANPRFFSVRFRDLLVQNLERLAGRQPLLNELTARELAGG